MVLIEDTRQKTGKHKKKHEWWTAHGDEVIRCELPFGDYALPPTCVVDTKADLMEIATNMCGPRKEQKRFKNECVRAQECGCKLYFLIESGEGAIDDLIGKTIRLGSGRFITGDQLAIAMHVMQDRYGCTFLFCKKENSAEIINILLTWEKRTEEKTT